MKPRSVPTIIALLALLVVVPSPAADEDQRRPVVTVVTFAGGGETEDHWRYSLASALRGRLGKVKALRVRGGGFGRRKIGLAFGVPPSQEQAFEIGLLVEAQHVLRGTVTRSETGWKVTAFLLTPATGKEEAIHAEGGDFWAIRDNTVTRVLERLGVPVADEEKEKVLKRWTASAEALQLVSQAHAVAKSDGPYAETEALLRKAIALDPDSDRIWTSLAWVCQSLEKNEEADEANRRALEIDPDNTDSLYYRAIREALLVDESVMEKTLARILELDPEEVDALQLLARKRLYANDEPEEALALLRRAKRIAPMNGKVRANEALALAKMGKRPEAETALREAVRLAVGDDPPIDLVATIARTATVMGKQTLALRSLRQVVAAARKSGESPTTVKRMEESIVQLEARQKPVPIAPEVPRSYTDQELQEAFHNLLTPDERDGIENPLAVTPEMVEWARSVVAGADGERATAEALFKVMDRRLDHVDSPGARTAREVFARWDNPVATFSCQEYAKLYVGLARQLGLQAFFVEVKRDDENDPVFHACAAVRADGEWFLADPTYDWFGVPHQQFDLLNDLQTTAIHYAQPRHEDGRIHDYSDYGAGSLTHRRLATKLFPESAYVRSSLALKLISEGSLEEARKELAEADRLDAGRWEVSMARGMIAEKEGDPDQVQEFMEEALRLNPKSPDCHANLGVALARQGQAAEARERFRDALSHHPYPAREQSLLEQIARINELIGTSEDSPVGRALRMWKEGDLEGAVGEFGEALRQEPDTMVHHLRLGQCLGELGRGDEAEHHMRRAMELKPESDVPRRVLAYYLFGAGKYEECRTLLENRLQEDPENGDCLVLLARIQMVSEDQEQSLHTLRKSIAVGHRSTVANVLMAAILSHSGCFEEAETQLKSAAIEDLEDVGMLISASNSWLKLGRLRKARHCLGLAKDRIRSSGNTKIEESVSPLIEDLERYISQAQEMEDELLEALRNGDPPRHSGTWSQCSMAIEAMLRNCIIESDLEPCFKERHDEVLRELEEREVTNITLANEEGALKLATGIRDRLREGQAPAQAAGDAATVQDRDWFFREDLHQAMQEPVFNTPPGEVSDVIDGNSFLAVSMVHASRPGQGGTLDDDRVKEAVKTVLARERLTRWQERYLSILESLIEEEAAGATTKPPSAP